MAKNGTRKTNRILSLLLALCMTASLVVLPQFEQTAEAAKTDPYVTSAHGMLLMSDRNVPLKVLTNSDGKVTYSVEGYGDNPGAATINSSGQITPTKVGSIKITIKTAATSTYNAGEHTFNSYIEDASPTYFSVSNELWTWDTGYSYEFYGWKNTTASLTRSGNTISFTNNAGAIYKHTISNCPATLGWVVNGYSDCNVYFYGNDDDTVTVDADYFTCYELRGSGYPHNWVLANAGGVGAIGEGTNSTNNYMTATAKLGTGYELSADKKECNGVTLKRLLNGSSGVAPTPTPATKQTPYLHVSHGGIIHQGTGEKIPLVVDTNSDGKITYSLAGGDNLSNGSVKIDQNGIITVTGWAYTKIELTVSVSGTDNYYPVSETVTTFVDDMSQTDLPAVGESFDFHQSTSGDNIFSDAKRISNNKFQFTYTDGRVLTVDFGNCYVVPIKVSNWKIPFIGNDDDEISWTMDWTNYKGSSASYSAGDMYKYDGLSSHQGVGITDGNTWKISDKVYGGKCKLNENSWFNYNRTGPIFIRVLGGGTKTSLTPEVECIEKAIIPVGTTQLIFPYSSNGRTDFEFTSSDPSVAMVGLFERNGVTGLKTGTATITVKLPATGLSKEVVKTIKVKVVNRSNSWSVKDRKQWGFGRHQGFTDEPWGVYFWQYESDLSTGKTLYGYHSQSFYEGENDDTYIDPPAGIYSNLRDAGNYDTFYNNYYTRYDDSRVMTDFWRPRKAEVITFSHTKDYTFELPAKNIAELPNIGNADSIGTNTTKTYRVFVNDSTYNPWNTDTSNSNLDSKYVYLPDLNGMRITYDHYHNTNGSWKLVDTYEKFVTIRYTLYEETLPEIINSELTLFEGEPENISRGEGYTYESSDESIVQVTQDGAATGVKEGTAIITVRSEGKLEFIKVTVKKSNPPTITYENVNAYVGRTTPLGAAASSGGALTYVSEDPSILTIDENGIMTGVSEGVTTVVINAAANGAYSKGSKKVQICVNPNDMPPTHVRDYTFTSGDVSLRIELTKPYCYIDTSTSPFTLYEYAEDTVNSDFVNTDSGPYRVTMTATSGVLKNVYAGLKSNGTSSYFGTSTKVGSASYTRYTGYTYTKNNRDSGDQIYFKATSGRSSYSSDVATSEFKLNHAYAAPAKDIDIGIEDMDMEVGDIYSFEGKLGRNNIALPSDYNNTTDFSSYKVADSSIVGISNATVNKDNSVYVNTVRVVAKKLGSTEFTLTYPEKRHYKQTSKTITINVGKKGINLKAKDQEVTFGDNTKKLTDGGAVSTTQKATFKFESSDPEFAEVDENTGLITPHRLGTTQVTITATPTDEESYKTETTTIQLKIVPDIICKTTKVNIGSSIWLNAYVAGNSGARVNYELVNSSDSEYMTVSTNGYVTALKATDANSQGIPVRLSTDGTSAYDAFSKIVYITVSPKMKPYLSVSNMVVRYKEEAKLDVKTDSDGTVKYELLPVEIFDENENVIGYSDEDVISVDQDGTVHGLDIGKQRVRVTISETDKYDSNELIVDVVSVNKALTELTVEPHNLVIKETEIAELTATASRSGEELDSSMIRYSSNDSGVATVDSEGNVTGVSVGSTYIYVSVNGNDYYNGAWAYIPVTVEEFVPGNEPAELEADDMELEYGERKAINVTKHDGGALSYEITGGDDDVISIDRNGVITGLKQGTTQVTIKAAPTLKYADSETTIWVTVKGLSTGIVAADGTDIPDTITMVYGSKVNIGATATTGAEVEYFLVSGSEYISIDGDNNIIGEKPGNAVVRIEAKASGDYDAASKTVNVIVTKAQRTITIYEPSITLHDKVQLEAYTEGEYDFEYESSNEEAITVDENGILEAVSMGEAVITVKAPANDYYEYAEETISLSVRKIESSISSAGFNIMESDSRTIEFETNCPDTEGVEFISSDPQVAQVDENGVVTGISASSDPVNITIRIPGTDEYSSAATTISVLVEQLAPGPNTATITAKSLEIVCGETAALEAEIDSGARLKYEVAEGSEEIISVDEDGNVTGLKPGTAQVNITADGTRTHQPIAVPVPVSITVKGKPGEITFPEREDGAITYDGDDTIITVGYGETINLNAESNSGMPVIYYNQTPGIVSVDTYGNMTGIAITPDGEYGSVLVACVSDGREYEGTSKQLKIRVVPGKPNIKVGNTSVIYNSSSNLNVSAGDLVLHYVSDNPGLVSVNEETGEMTAHRLPEENEKVYITITSDPTDEYAAGEEKVEITVERAYPVIRAGNVGVQVTGTKQVQVETEPADAVLSYEIVQEDADEVIATVDAETGVVTGVNAGHTKLKIIFDGTDEYRPDYALVDVYVDEFEAGTTPTSIYNIEDNIEIEYGESLTLDAKATSGAPVTYVSSKSDIVKVEDDGKTITGMSTGDAQIVIHSAPTLVYAAGEKTINIKVVGADPTFENVKEEYNVAYGETITFIKGLVPEEPSADEEPAVTDSSVPMPTVNSGAEIKFISSMSDLIEINNESKDEVSVKGIEIGTAYIDLTAKAPEGSSYNDGTKRIKINVVPAEPKITVKNASVDYLGTARLVIQPSDKSGNNEYTANITYDSANTDTGIAVIDADGNMTGVHAGKTSVDYSIASTKYYRAKSGTLEVTVNKISPTFRIDTLDMMVGESGYVTPVNIVDDGAEFSFTYGAEDDTYIDVDPSTGKVTAKAVGGPVSISIRSDETDDYISNTAYTTVQVTEFVPGTADPELSVTSIISVNYGDEYYLRPSAKSPGTITYTVPEEYKDIIEVDSNGKITGKKRTEAGEYAEVKVRIAATRDYRSDEKTVQVAVIGITPELSVVEDPENNVTADGITVAYKESVAFDIDTDSNGDFTFRSSNPDVVTVERDGTRFKVTGKAAGSQADIFISVGADGNFGSRSISIPVTVVKATPTISVSNTSIKFGFKEDLGVNVASKDERPTITYTSDDTNIRVNGDGTVEGLGITESAGIQIDVSATTNYEAVSETVYISVIQAEAPIAITNPITLIYGQSVELNPKSDATNVFSYALKDKADEEFITLDPETGTITGVKAGSATVVIETEDTTNYLGDKKEITVNVIEATPEIVVNQETTYYGLVGGDAFPIGARAVIDNVVVPGIVLEYSSSDENIAVVDDLGNVAMRKAETAQITITAEGIDGEYNAPAAKTVIVEGIPTVPGAPPILRVAEIDDQAITLEWEEPESDGGIPIDKYVLMKSTDGVSFVALNDNISPGTYMYTDTDVINGKTYTYYIFAENSEGPSKDTSNYVDAKSYTVPSKPSDFSANATSANSVLLSWFAPEPEDNGGDEVKDFDIKVYTENDRDITRLITIGEKDKVYDEETGRDIYTVEVSGLAGGTTYKFTAESVNSATDDGKHGDVSTATATTWDYASEPRSLAVEPTSKGEADVSWEAPENNGGTEVTGYILEYRSEGENSWTRVSDVEDTTCHLDNLDADKKYEFRVAAVNEVGTGRFSETLLTAIIKKPDAPKLVKAESGNNGIYITAKNTNNNGSDVTSYNIYISQNGGSEIKKEADAVNENLNEYFVSGLTNGSRYEITVTAVNAAGESERSETHTVMPGSPLAVENLKASLEPGQQVSISFDPADGNGSTITGYDIYIGGTIEGADIEFAKADPAKLTKISDTEYSYDAFDRLHGDTISVYVVARNAVSEAKSDTVSVSIGAPGATTIKDSYVDNNGIHLEWTPSEPNGYKIDGYTIYIIDEDGNRTPLPAPNDGSYKAYVRDDDDYPFEEGRTYTVYMTSSNSSGESVPSEPVTFTFGAPSKPRNVTGNAGSGTLSLSWTEPEYSGADAVNGYYVYLNNDADVALEITWEKSSSLYQLYVKDNRKDKISKPYGNTVSSVESVSVELDGLANGVSYEAYVSARNSVAEGQKAKADIEGTTAAAASVPRNVTGEAVSGTQIDVSWAKPLTDGGSVINKYVVAAYEVARKDYTTGEYKDVTETKVGEKESTTLDCEFTELTAGSEYVFMVAAVTDAGPGEWSDESARIRTFTRPSKPVITHLTSGLGTTSTLPLTVSWDAPEDNGGTPITGYDIFVKTETGTTMQMNLDGGKIAPNKMEYTINDARLKNGKQYSVVVTVYNDVTGDSLGVNSDSRSITLGTISPPDGITATADAAGNINISWPSEQYSDIQDYIRSYVIYANGAMADTTDTNSAVLTGFNLGDTVTIEVSVMNVYGNEGSKSEPVVVKVGAPQTVTNLTASAAKDGAVLEWDEADCDSYNIYVDGALYDTTDGAATSKTITGLDGGREYEIYVAAANSYGEGAKSNTAKVTPWSNPDAPKIGEIKHGDGSFSMKVTDGSGNGTDIKGHKVYVDGTLAGNTSENNGIITVSSVSNDSTHSVCVTALGTAPDTSVLESEKSEAYSVKTGVPDAPEYLKAIAGDSTAEVVFSKSPDVSSSYPTLGYQVTQDGIQVSDNVLASSISADGKYRITFEGLENGRTYNYAVRAYNGIGYGEYTQSVSVIPGTPKDPAITEIKPLSESLDVSWTIPESNAGKISKYIIYVNGTAWMEASENHAVVTGLKNGETYSIELSAYNYIGEGAKSDPAEGTPVGTAATVTNVEYEAVYENGECKVTLTWDMPTDNGGLTVTDFDVTGDGDIDISITENGGKAVITGLEPGKEYKFNVIPINDAGEGKAYTVTVNTPDVPSAPNIIEATSYNKSIIASWNAPETTGGSDIIKYIVYAVPENGGAEINVETEPKINENGEYSAVITEGLELNKAYSVTVSAVNAIGEGDRSRSIKMWVRDALKPTVPGAPQEVTAIARDGKVVISWKAPLTDGNKTITKYNIWGGNSGSGEAGMSLVGSTTDGYTFTFTDENLANGVERMYRVNAVNEVSSDGGDFSETVKATPIHLDMPTKPEWPVFDKTDGVSAYEMDPTGNRMTLTWTASTADENAGQISYQIYINDALQDTVQTTTYTFSEVLSKKGAASALDESKVYNVRVCAVDEAENVTESELISVNKLLNIRKGIGEGFEYDSRYAVGLFAAIDADYDGDEDVKSELTGPSAPQNVLLTQESDTKAYLTWKTPQYDGGRNILGYNVYVNGDKTRVDVNSNRDGDGYKLDIDLRYGQMYIIYVTAYNDIDEGDISEKQFINPTVEYPSGLAFTIDSEGKTTRDEEIKLTWDTPNNEATAYMLYVNGIPEILELRDVRDASGIVSPFSVSSGSKLTYTYNGELGNEYSFAVSSMYDTVESNLSNTIVVDTNETLPVPTITGSEAENGTVALTWTATPEEGDAEIAKYYIYANGEMISESTETTANVRLFESALLKVAAVSTRGTVGKASRPVEYNHNSGKTYSQDAPPAPININYEPEFVENVLVRGRHNVTVTWEPGDDENYTGVTHHYFVDLDGDRFQCDTAEFTFEAVAGKDYYFKVQAATFEGEMGPQATKILEIPENEYNLPAKPENLEVKLKDGKAIVTWEDDGSDDTTYYLLINGDYVTDENGDKVPITNGYEYSLEDDEGGNKNFQVEAVRKFEQDGTEQGVLSDIESVNTTGTDEINSSYDSDKPVITKAISSGTKVKIFWSAPEPRTDDNGEVIESGAIAEYRILIDGVEQSGSVSKDANPLVYETDLGSLGAKAEVKVEAYKYINGEPFVASTSDGWTISPNVNRVVNEEDYEDNNPDAKVTNPDTDHDGNEDAQENDIHIPINVPNEYSTATLTDQFDKQREVSIVKTDDGKFELVVKEDNSFTSESEYTLVISSEIYTSYTLTGIPNDVLNNELEITTVTMYVGDFNGDGKISTLDMATFSSNQGKAKTEDMSDHDMFKLGDFNGDRKISTLDSAIISSNLGKRFTIQAWE